MVRRRDIILARVYFSDSSESKIRPAIVLSNDDYHKTDFLFIASISTANDEYCLPISEKNINCTLDSESGARFDGVLKLHNKQMIKVIGKVSVEFYVKLLDKIISMVK